MNAPDIQTRFVKMTERKIISSFYCEIKAPKSQHLQSCLAMKNNR